jgi:hypothetical protein
MWKFKLSSIIFYLLTLTSLFSCSHKEEAVRAVYHWKTTYNPTQWELDWMRDHHVKRLYLKLFDVDVYDCKEGAAPIATTRFLQPLPDGIEVVPVVYITNEAMRHMQYWEVVPALTTRVMKMAECKGFEVKEVQVDCDWTESTKQDYFWFCRFLCEQLHEQGIRLSSTVRLHQVDSTLNELQVDDKTLMLYNTGTLRSPQTRNSILDLSDVKPYLPRLTHEVMDSMTVAWPVFGWGVAFDPHGAFQRLVLSAGLATDTSAHLREEWGEVSEIRQVQRRLPRRRDGSVTILYHLDSLNLSRYSYDEIEEIYSR